MKELILIHGTNLEKAKKALKEAAKDMNNDDFSITTLRLYTTRDDNTFAVRPNRLCAPWHFSILCDSLLYALESDKDAYIEAWFVLTVEYTMDEVPKYKKLYLSFDKEGWRRSVSRRVAKPKKETVHYLSVVEII